MAIRRRARLGQVFLADRRVEKRILEALRLRPSDAVLEIGAGPGNMTARLAREAAQVVAVELDPRWAQSLREQFSGQGRVRILEADILKVSLDVVAQELGCRRLKVFGNLPYYITSPCLLHLFRYCDWIEEITVMVQREVAERITAPPGSREYGLFTVTCQYYTRPRLLFTIPPGAFRNPPRVESALVQMPVAPQKETLGIRDEAEFWEWMRAAFAQKRKTLANNWKGWCSSRRLRAAMETRGIERTARAESLSLAQLASLYVLLRGPGEE
ncbi:MAG TPA: 16S rRNA (adenine(1518)-N(6)/adenine(1519)-N(6))-dimethyltransferase RsmA [Terriglobia bacterium]|nr:16S rRNA (adenine(1518)-N(6)/adenine(1519)-N(6))-dimethyltransferase RsmA [Terriglobia bacterium]